MGHFVSYIKILKYVIFWQSSRLKWTFSLMERTVVSADRWIFMPSLRSAPVTCRCLCPSPSPWRCLWCLFWNEAVPTFSFCKLFRLLSTFASFPWQGLNDLSEEPFTFQSSSLQVYIWQFCAVGFASLLSQGIRTWGYPRVPTPTLLSSDCCQLIHFIFSFFESCFPHSYIL